ncbi:MAG: right-handed parallel beta-helix repeat-containing protein [Bacteroidetes bacterium]|nr:right-handed parallel beta-helix repeat-containing protein [Bacteroidota bacterium]
MKKVLPALLVCFMIFPAFILPTNAAKWRVNNTGIEASFTTVQQAANSVSVLPGDTLYLEGSMTSYGSLNLAKRLVIIGPGYFLGQNPATQASLAPATIDYLTFSAGSKGSQVTGVTVASYTSVQDSAIYLIRNNLANVGVGALSSDNYFAQNYMYALSISGSSGNRIVNNLVTKSDNCPNGACFYMSNNSSAIVRNNIFKGCQVINGCVYENNIATGTAALGNNVFTATISTVNNNVGASSQYGSGNGNKQDIDMSLVFANTGSDDGRYQLLPGSPASGAGTNGVDCGIFGGATSYVLSGVPNLPSVWYMNISGSTVTVKAVSH